MSTGYGSLHYDRKRLQSASSQSASTWLFGYLFSSLVYNQLWEDPLVDIEALSLGPAHRLVGIASAGCNILSYLSANPDQIVAVDINRSHLALAELKLHALQHLQSYDDFFLFFGEANSDRNLDAYRQFVRPNLSPAARQYWDGAAVFGRPRIHWFANKFYRHGILSRFVGLFHLAARLTGHDPFRLVHARTLTEQRTIFDEEVAPLFDNAFMRAFVKSPLSLFALGIPPAQYENLVESANGDLHALLRSRIERLTCDFPIDDNYFAWQVFTRQYDVQNRKAIPHYLQPETYARIRDRAARVDLRWVSLLDFLSGEPANSIHRYVLLDAQDWMSAEQVVALWEQIDRTADARDARVIFRTGGNVPPPARAVSSSVLGRWSYLEADSRRLYKQDRASIYGGFHIYTRRV
jgi:S-adenosylmethionine-diacylglycerol 3-amino-3-carboxypropyl transferase